MPNTHKTAPRTRSRRERPVKTSRIAKTPRQSPSSPRLRTGVIAAAAVMAAGAAGAAAIVMRKQLRRLALDAAAEAVSIGRSIGQLHGMRRPSMFSRLLPASGLVAIGVAVAGSALYLTLPKLRAAARTAVPHELDGTAEWSGEARPKGNSVHDGAEAGSHAAT
jgi:hypothetical protein